MPRRLVFYRDVEMTEDWPERIRQAQRFTVYTIAGEVVARLRFGREGRGWGAAAQCCHDCAVIQGEYHVPGCDMERCPGCRGQAISCGCDIDWQGAEPPA